MNGTESDNNTATGIWSNNDDENDDIDCYDVITSVTNKKINITYFFRVEDSSIFRWSSDKCYSYQVLLKKVIK